ncbi:hypothetical protein ACFE04_029182 [Oxalis oulophora]
MAERTFLPFYEKVAVRRALGRALDLAILFLLFSLLVYRLLHLINYNDNEIDVIAWSLALLCESWFAFNWFLTVNIKWNPMECITYPSRLLQSGLELPPVDMFVTTADSTLEPPIITVNTVISLLAVDYPAEKLACYVSDDGCSPLTYYSLIEGFKFAKIWVPFCKKYNIQVRAPFRYFSQESITFGSKAFQEDWKLMKYEELNQIIEAASRKSNPCEMVGEYSVFRNVKRGNHPAIIKIIWENKEGESDCLPHLVYISREKRLEHPHNYKAGAMNVLTRVSGLMTNAPYMLNVDCDMYVNNPQVVLHAMCFLLGSINDKESGFVQFPQKFYDGLKDDPFGNQLSTIYEYVGKGIGGIQGLFYCGTGCFHRRKAIYGSWPSYKDKKNEEKLHSSSSNGNVVADLQELITKFGSSKELMKSACDALNEVTNYSLDLTDCIEAAYKISSSNYEYATSWGSEIGWMYGSTVEDINTGLKIHSKGWCSLLASPEPPAFLGCAPSNGPDSMKQQKRWATGILEILFTKNNPILLTLNAKLQVRQCLAYLWIMSGYAASSIPELGYSLLPAYCIITNSTFLPKVSK